MKKSALFLTIMTFALLFMSCNNNEKQTTITRPHYYGAVEVKGVEVYGDTSVFTSKVNVFGTIKIIKRTDNCISYVFESPLNDDSIYISSVEMFYFDGQIASVIFTYHNTSMLKDAIVEKYKKYDNFLEDYDAPYSEITPYCYKLGKTKILIGKSNSISYKLNGERIYYDYQRIEYKNDDIWNNHYTLTKTKKINVL